MIGATFVAYIPGGGGNHLKNIMSLDPSFANSDDLDESVYSEITQPVGTVHSVPGRNLHEVYLQRAIDEPNRSWLLLGHFGELALWRDKILSIYEKRVVLITIDHDVDRRLIMERNDRLQQNIHPYWLNEEQYFLYQPAIYNTYFRVAAQDIFSIPLHHFWHPDLQKYHIVDRLNSRFGLNIPVDRAQRLHDLWWKYNFFFDWSPGVRTHYDVKTPPEITGR
jgi:hypothetical protein